MRSYPVTEVDGQPIGFGCGPKPPTAGDIAIVREFGEYLRIRKAGLALEPVRCRCPHGDDWHTAGGCEARDCPCEVEPR